MIRCYLVAVCTGSSRDTDTQNMTLFNLIERCEVYEWSKEVHGEFLPFEIHAYFFAAPSDETQVAEVRVVQVSTDGSEAENASPPAMVTFDKPHMRAILKGLPYNGIPGSYDVRAEWRASADQPWTHSTTSWPLEIVAVSRPSDASLQ